jgi:hypothetical protein
MKHLDKPAHVGPFILMGQIDIHIDGGDRILRSLTAIANGYRVSQIFDADLVNGDVAVVALILRVFHNPVFYLSK